MRLALAQIDSDTDIDRNLALVREGVRAAASAGARLVVFPEYTMYEKSVVDDTFAVVAQPVDGPFVAAVSSLAREERIAVVVGIVETRRLGSRPFNTLVAIDESGRLVGRYRKYHLYDAYGFRESAWIERPESEAVVVTLGGARIGLMTCSDLRHPELAGRLVRGGAEIVAVCASWVPGPTKVGQWRVLARARAIENLCFVAAVSQAPPVSIGRSLVVDPRGSVVAELDAPPGLLLVDVNTDLVHEQRRLAAS